MKMKELRALCKERNLSTAGCLEKSDIVKVLTAHDEAINPQVVMRRGYCGSKG